MSQPGPALAATDGEFPNDALAAAQPAAWPNTNCAVQNCAAFAVLTRLNFNMAAGTAVEDATLLVDMCGGGPSHGVGGIQFSSTRESVALKGMVLQCTTIRVLCCWSLSVWSLININIVLLNGLVDMCGGGPSHGVGGIQFSSTHESLALTVMLLQQEVPRLRNRVFATRESTPSLPLDTSPDCKQACVHSTDTAPCCPVRLAQCASPASQMTTDDCPCTPCPLLVAAVLPCNSCGHNAP